MLSILQRFVDQVFGGDTPNEPISLWQIAARAVFVYLAGLLIVRIGKGRMVGRLTSLDILLGFIVGSLLSRGITGHASLSGTLIASLAMVASHWALTWIACRWHWFGNALKGAPVLLIRDGEILSRNLRRSHISEHDLAQELRLHGVESPHEVRLAYKERDGEFSVLLREPGPS